MSEFKHGDRVLVTDPVLAKMREIMRGANGEEPAPNHHGTVKEIWDDGATILIYFDDGVGAPYPVAEVEHLATPEETSRLSETTHLCPPEGSGLMPCCDPRESE